MTLVRRLGFNSLVYTGTQFLQRGAAFLLLPLYTRFLAPEEYGILAVVVALNGFLSIVFTFALHGAITRFYFEYREDKERLREFWGTVLTFVACSSVVGSGLLLLTGEFLLAPILGEIDFWPFVAVGIVAVVFQPFVTTFLNILQTRGEALRYAGYSLANFLTTTAITIALVVFAGWGALGPLMATLIAAVVFCIVALYQLRHEFRICMNFGDLRQALLYCLPQIPHSIGAQVIAATDRLLLNRIAGPTVAGIYNVAAIFGVVVDLVGYSVNRAFVPIAMDVRSRNDPEQHATLRDLGLLLVGVFLVLGCTISLFARELIVLMLPPAYHSGFLVVPLVAMGGAASGVYYVLVNILFFDVRATRYLPFGLLSSATVSVALNLLLIPRYGMVGAGLANLAAQVTTTVVIGFIGRRFETVAWPYWRITIAYCLCLAAVLPIAYLAPDGVILALAVKSAVLLLLAAAIGVVLWRDHLYLFRWDTYGFHRGGGPVAPQRSET